MRTLDGSCGGSGLPFQVSSSACPVTHPDSVFLFHRRRNNGPVTGDRSLTPPCFRLQISCRRCRSLQIRCNGRNHMSSLHVRPPRLAMHVPFVRLCSGIAPLALRNRDAVHHAEFVLTPLSRAPLQRSCRCTTRVVQDGEGVLGFDGVAKG